MHLTPTHLTTLLPLLSLDLQKISDADPQTLAEYVLELVKHERSNKELKELCIEMLRDFLGKRKEQIALIS